MVAIGTRFHPDSSDTTRHNFNFYYYPVIKRSGQIWQRYSHQGPKFLPPICLPSLDSGLLPRVHSPPPPLAGGGPAHQPPLAEKRVPFPLWVFSPPPPRLGGSRHNMPYWQEEEFHFLFGVFPVTSASFSWTIPGLGNGDVFNPNKALLCW